MSTKRVMIIEDSDVVRRLLEHIIEGDGRLSVAASVTTAEDGLRLLPTVRPDVISMDINLPGMDGLEATQRIMTEHPTPIVIVSSTIGSQEPQASLEALRAGALAVTEKPVGPGHPAFGAMAQQLRNRLVLMSDVPVIRQRQGRVWRTPKPAPASGVSTASPTWGQAINGPKPRYLAVVASTGGPQALTRLFSDLGPDFPLPIFLVQHITAAFVESFAGWLQSVSQFPVTIAADAMRPQPGHVYLAPADCHLTVASAPELRLRLSGAPPVSGQRPSGSVLFESLALCAGEETIGVLLTGMGDDGAAGLLTLREAGGYTIAEAASTAVVYGMPGSAMSLGAVMNSLPLHEIGGHVSRLIRTRFGNEARTLESL